MIVMAFVLALKNYMIVIFEPALPCNWCCYIIFNYDKHIENKCDDINKDNIKIIQLVYCSMLRTLASTRCSKVPLLSHCRHASASPRADTMAGSCTGRYQGVY